MSSSTIFIGMHGRAFCLDRGTGQVLWSTDLKGVDFVTLLTDGDVLLAATHGEVFCLQSATGKILWRNEMPGQGFGLVSIATDTSAANPVSADELRRRQAAAASAGAAG